MSTALAPELLLPRSYERVAHALKCEVLVPAGARVDEVTRACMRAKERFVADMYRQGYVYTGRPMRQRGPYAHVEPRALPRVPERRRYGHGEPHPNREAEYRDRMDAVADVPLTAHADTWRFILVGEFHAPPLLIEHD